MKKVLLICVLFCISIWLCVLSFDLTKIETNSSNEVNEYTVTGFSTDLSKIVDNNKQSVVTITCGENTSTGFIYNKIDNNLYVVTTLHGLDNYEVVDVYLHSGLKLVGSMKAYDVYLDLALVECQIETEVLPITCGDVNLLKDGVFVIGIGTAGSKEFDFSSQFGIVSSNHREVENSITYNDEDYDYFGNYIQLSGEFISGYSGSPLFNMNGEVVGMIDKKIDDIVLATPINEIKMVVDKMINNEEYSRFNYGISGKYLENLENYEKSSLNIGLETTSGYYIEKIKQGSFANNIGLSKGDVIISINNITITNYDSMLHAVYDGFESYSIVVMRNNEKIKFEGTIND